MLWVREKKRAQPKGREPRYHFWPRERGPINPRIQYRRSEKSSEASWVEAGALQHLHGAKSTELYILYDHGFQLIGIEVAPARDLHRIPGGGRVAPAVIQDPALPRPRSDRKPTHLNSTPHILP